jgi:hypothetical protein
VAELIKFEFVINLKSARPSTESANHRRRGDHNDPFALHGSAAMPAEMQMTMPGSGSAPAME